MSTKTLSNGWEVDAAWSPIAEMSTKRQEHAAVALNDHQCLVMGGSYRVDDSWQCLSSVELYDKITNMWTKLPDMKEKRAGPASAVVGNVVYAIGGFNGEQCHASVEVLDLNKPPEQRQWTVLKPPMTKRCRGCAAAVVGQKIYVMGGKNSSSNLSSVEIFDMETQEWSHGPSMTTERSGCAAVAIGTTIYAMGGKNINDEELDTVECLNVLATGNNWKWTLLPQSMSSKRWFPAATVIGGCIVVVGGSSTSSKTAELWDPEYQKWTLLPSMSTARFAGAAVTLGTTVLVMGGYDATGNWLTSGELLHFTKISFPASSYTSRGSTFTVDTMYDYELSLAEWSKTLLSRSMPQFHSRSELDVAISNVKVKLERARSNVRQSPCMENLRAFRSIHNQLDDLEHHREDIKDQFPSAEELQEEFDSLSSMFDSAMHNNDFDQMEMLIAQLSFKQGQLKKEQAVQSRNNVGKAMTKSRQSVVNAMNSLFPSEAVEISSHYLQNITQTWSNGSFLGSGGFGEVYQGIDKVTCIAVAVKRFHSTSGTGHLSIDMQKQLEAEIKVLSKLSHPNIVHLLAYAANQSSDGADTVRGDFFYMVYEYAAGGSMQAILEDETKRKTYPWRLRLQSCLSLVSALRYLHDQGFNHRDVKPDNICFTDESLEQIVLIGFGIACSKVFDGDKIHSTLTSNPGTLAYMAPEYVEKKKFTVKSEIYSVGVVIAALLTGSSSMGWVRRTGCSSGNLLDKVDLLGGDWGNSVISNELADLAVDCMSHSAMDRPSFDTLAKKLTDLKLRTERPLTEKEMTSMNTFKHTQSGRHQAGAQLGLSAQCTCGQAAGGGLYCKSGHFACRACLEQHVLDQLGADKIACPHSGCRRYYIISDLCGHVPNDVFVRHYAASTDDVSRMQGGFYFKENVLNYKEEEMSQKLDAAFRGVALSTSGEAKCPRLCIMCEQPLTEKEVTSKNIFKHTQSGRPQAGAQPGLPAQCTCGQAAGNGLYCKSGHFTCPVCLEQHVLDQLGADTIICPHSCCKRHYLIDDLYGKVSNDVFVRHYDALRDDESRVRGEIHFKENLLNFKEEMSRKLDAVLKGVALSASGEAKCPRLCILWPLKSRRGIRLSFKKEYRLIFLCAHDRSPIQTFIHLQKPKDWVKKAIPVLKFTLFALRVLALAGGLPLPLPSCIPGSSPDSQLNAVSEVMHEFLNGNDMKDFDNWLNDLSNSGPLDEKRVMLQLSEKGNKIEGEAYGAISKIACLPENLGWQTEMELVNKNTNDVWAWVKKESVQKWKDS